MWSSAALGAAATRALRKLEAAGVELAPLPEGLQPRLEASGAAFPLLAEAVHDGRVVQFDYRAGTGTEQARRSVYVFVKRNLRYPFFEAFDMPDTHESCARRAVTTTPTQTLMLMNDEVVLRSASAFAGRVLKEAGVDARRQVERAYLLAYSRLPTLEESSRAKETRSWTKRPSESAPRARLPRWNPAAYQPRPKRSRRW